MTEHEWLACTEPGRMLTRVAAGRPEDSVIVGERDVLVVDGKGGYHHMDGETVVDLLTGRE